MWNVELEMVSLPGTGIRNSKCGIGNGLPACGRTLKSERRNAGSGKGKVEETRSGNEELIPEFLRSGLEKR